MRNHSAGMSPNIDGFWRWFQEQEVTLFEIVTGLRVGKVTDLLNEALRRFALDLTYEITNRASGAELTFTPLGDRDRAEFVDRVVAAAPTLRNWVVYGRCQRKPLEEALAFVSAIHRVDLHGASFKISKVPEGGYRLTVLHDDLSGLDPDFRLEVGGTFLDHALGEQMTMELIDSLEFAPSGEGIEMALLINTLITENADRLGSAEGTDNADPSAVRNRSEPLDSTEEQPKIEEFENTVA